MLDISIRDVQCPVWLTSPRGILETERVEQLSERVAMGELHGTVLARKEIGVLDGIRPSGGRCSVLNGCAFFEYGEVLAVDEQLVARSSCDLSDNSEALEVCSGGCDRDLR